MQIQGRRSTEHGLLLSAYRGLPGICVNTFRETCFSLLPCQGYVDALICLTCQLSNAGFWETQAVSVPLPPRLNAFLVGRRGSQRVVPQEHKHWQLCSCKHLLTITCVKCREKERQLQRLSPPQGSSVVVKANIFGIVSDRNVS